MASGLNWIPDSLYNTCVSAAVENYHDIRSELQILPENVQFDVFHKLYEQNRLCQLSLEFCELDNFSRVLNVGSKRQLLHHSFQALMDHGTRIAHELSVAYNRRCTQAVSNYAIKEKTVQLGLKLGNFLSDCGWFSESSKVLSSCQLLCQKSGCDVQHWRWELECCHRLLHAQTTFCLFSEAEVTMNRAKELVEILNEAGDEPNLAGLYVEFSYFFFIKSNYDEAYRWTQKALRSIVPTLPPRVLVDVLRQAAKSCVVKREFKKAELLNKQAVYLAREVFGEKHQKYSDCLLDYGFYLLNADSVYNSVHVYRTALDIRLSIFCGNNLNVAVAHEDLAYALYVREYSSGRFQTAREHAEKAMQILHHILPSSHLLLSSSKRVMSLILEEIAIDNAGNDAEKKLLHKAHDLHQSALELAKQAFGEINVQTAKHYGNLGRLYQSMRRLEEAEVMHLRAIEIKEKLLGPEDYEVALSVGHLASLYNYDMQQYKKAEQLYIRSIAIGRKLFGESYSGLEYDYRGLLRVYNKLGNAEKMTEYQYILTNWKVLRDKNARQETPPLCPTEKPLPVAEIVHRFFSMESGPLCTASMLTE